MDEAATIAAALLGACAGSGLGFLGARRISERERREVGVEDLRRACGRYLGVLYRVVGLLLSMPDGAPNRASQALGKLTSESTTWVQNQRALAAMGLPELQTALALAVGDLQARQLPPRLDAAVMASMEFVEALGRSRSDELRERWPQILADLREAVHALPE